MQALNLQRLAARQQQQAQEQSSTDVQPRRQKLAVCLASTACLN